MGRKTGDLTTESTSGLRASEALVMGDEGAFVTVKASLLIGFEASD